MDHEDQVNNLENKVSDLREQLSESFKTERNFRLAFENANIGICFVDLDKNIIKANSEMSNMFGYSIEELENLTVNSLAHPDDLNLSPQFIKKAVEGKADQSVFEKRYIHKKGHVIWGEVISSIVKNDNGDPLYFVSHVKDITDRKKAQDEVLQLNKQLENKIFERTKELTKANNELKAENQTRRKIQWQIEESEEKYRSIFLNSPVGIFRSTFEGRFLEVNPSLAKMLGYETSPEVLESIHNIGEQIYIKSERREEIVSSQLETSSFTHHVNHYRRRDGSTFIANLYLNTINNKYGQPACLQGIVEDITERKNAEVKLKEAQEIFSKAFKTAPILMTISSIEDGRYIELNNEFVKVTGYDPESTVGKTSVEIGFISQTDRNELKNLIESKGYIKNWELELSKADGTTMTCLYSAELISVSGKTRLLSIAIDITDQKIQQKEMNRKQSELEAHAKKLEDMNTALNVLIEHRSDEKENVKKEILKHFEKLVFPYFPASKGTKNHEGNSTVLSIIERNIKEILLKGDNKSLALYLGLTPMESQIAQMIKDGKTSKDIANILKLSVHTVYFHRENIRKKLDISKSDTNLKTYLQTQS